jgi:hypothetical protein
MKIKLRAAFDFDQFYIYAFPSAVLVLNLVWRPASMESIEHISQHSLLFCPFHALTGLLCPGCGMTRSMIAFFTGHFTWSLQFNPFGPFVALLPIYLWVQKFFSINPIHFKPWIGPIAVVLLLSWGLFRNLYWIF